MPSNKTDKKKAAPDPRIERAVKLPRVIKNELNDIKAVLGGMNNELRFLNEWKHEVTKKLNGSQEVDAIKEEKGSNEDPWVIAKVKKWQEQPPTDDQEGDSEATRRARADLRTVMDACGWDIYGGSSEPAVVAMNYAWNEGFLEAREQSYAKSAEEIEACAYGEREGLEKGMACECTGSQVDELRAIMVASDLFDPCYEGNEKRGAWLVWMPEHAGAPLQNYGKDEPPQANEIPFPVFKKLLIKTIEKLRSPREEEEAKKKLEFGTRVVFDGHKHGRIACEDQDADNDTFLISYKDKSDDRSYIVRRPRREFTIINP